MAFPHTGMFRKGSSISTTKTGVNPRALSSLTVEYIVEDQKPIVTRQSHDAMVVAVLETVTSVRTDLLTIYKLILANIPVWQAPLEAQKVQVEPLSADLQNKMVILADLKDKYKAGPAKFIFQEIAKNNFVPALNFVLQMCQVIFRSKADKTKVGRVLTQLPNCLGELGLPATTPVYTADRSVFLHNTLSQDTETSYYGLISAMMYFHCPETLKKVFRTGAFSQNKLYKMGPVSYLSQVIENENIDLNALVFFLKRNDPERAGLIDDMSSILSDISADHDSCIPKAYAKFFDPQSMTIYSTSSMPKTALLLMMLNSTAEVAKALSRESTADTTDWGMQRMKIDNPTRQKVYRMYVAIAMLKIVMAGVEEGMLSPEVQDALATLNEVAPVMASVVLASQKENLSKAIDATKAARTALDDTIYAVNDALGGGRRSQRPQPTHGQSSGTDSVMGDEDLFGE
jgi:hypothetical protein